MRTAEIQRTTGETDIRVRVGLDGSGTCDASTGVERFTIIEHKGDLHPQILIRDDRGNILKAYFIPERANIQVRDGEKVSAGTLIAKTPRELSKTQDITGGLPRVTEPFEARRPRNPAVMAEV